MFVLSHCPTDSLLIHRRIVWLFPPKCTSNFNQANFWGADLRQTNLTAAKVTPAQLKVARSLKNAIMPDSKRYTPQP